MKIRKTYDERIVRNISYLFVFLLALLCIYPFWHALMASFSESSLLEKHTGFLVKPLGFSLEGYKKVVDEKNIWTGILNTLFLLAVGIPLNLSLTTITAYFLAQKNALLNRFLLVFFMFTMYFSGGTIPHFLNLKDLHLTGTLWGLIFPSAVSTYNVLILRSSFESVPQSLYDAAVIDGAGHIRTIINVAVPLAKASLAVITLYVGLSIWNSWFWAEIILRNRAMWPLQLVLRNMIIVASPSELGLDEELSIESLKYTTMMVSIVPILCIYPFIQKHFTKGVMIGAVKG